MIYDVVPCVLYPLYGIKFSCQILCNNRLRRNIMIVTDTLGDTNR